MSKSLQRGILFSVCVALVLALSLTLVFFAGGGDKNILSAPEGQVSGVADAAANSYEHGSNIGRTVSSGAHTVTDVSTFLDALANNYDIDLQADLKLKTPKQNEDWRIDLASSQAFRASTANGTYSGTLFGNGHTISYEGIQDTTNRIASYLYDGRTFEDWDLGGIVNSLSGKIYDLNVVMTGGSAAFMAEGHNSLHVGGIVGYMYGSATIDNCTFTKEGEGRLASGMESSPGWNTGTKYAAVGGIVGRIATSGTPTITNCTVNWNGGTLEAGIYDGSGICNGSYGMAGLVVGVCYDVNASINKIIVNGSGTIKAAYAGNIGCTGSSGLSITVPYYLNNFNGQYSVGGSANSAWHSQSGSGSVTNRILGPNTNDTSSNPKIQSDSGFNVYFDPYPSDDTTSDDTTSDDTNFLAIEFTGVTYSPSQYDYSVTAAGNANVGGSFSASTNGVLVRNLPATPSTWNSGGTFTANLVKTSKFNPSSYAALTKYDHGYVDPDNRTTNGTAIGTGEDFEDVFSPSGTISGTDYYLTNDIVITGFTGKEFSGTLDGNGHTIFITGANTCAAQHIGGIVGTLTGTIKNVRVVLVNSVTANTSVSNANVGLVAGHINGGSLINVSVDIPADVTLKHTDSGNDSSLGGIAGSAVSGATFTNVTMNFNGTLSNIKTSGAGGGYWPFTSAFVGKPSVSQGTNSPANSATFNNIIIRGNGTFASQSSADDEPPYYAAIGIIQHKGVTNSTAAVYNVNGLIYDFNPQFADNQGATSGNHGACYGLFVNNNNNNAAQVQYYGSLVNYGSGGVYNASGEEIEAHAFNGNGNAPVPNPSKIKNITETVTGVDGSAVKAYFMPGDSASENLTLVASASNWNGVTQLQLDGAAPAVTSADDGSNKVVNVAKSTAVSISGKNLTLSPYNPYTVITASLDNPSKVYDGNPFAAQVSFDLDGGDLSLTEGQYTITYTDGNATGETNANASGGNYSLTVTLKGTASDGTQYVFDAQGTKTKTFTYTITPLEVTGTWSVRGLEITYGDSAPDYDQYISIELTNEGTIPGGLTESNIAAQGFNSDYVQGTTQAGNTVTITAGTFTVGSGFTASNYNFSGITGSGMVEVQKREITISATADLDPDAAGHIEATYGGTNYVTSQDSLAALLTWAKIGGFVNGRYGTDEIGFTITQVAHEGDTEAPGTAVDSGEWAKLPANDRYYITVESTNSNYTVAQGNYFTYYIAPAELTIDSVVWSGTNNNTTIYNGSAQTFTVNARGLVEGDNLEDVISTSVTYNNVVHSGNIINAGTYTITVNPAQDPSNYDLLVDVENTYDLTISPITLTINDVNAVYTDITAAEVVIAGMVIGILEGDSEGVTIDVVWDTTPADENGYLAAGTYNATLSLSGDKSANYTFGSDNIATVTVDQFDLSGAHITITSEQFTYDGTEKTVEYTVLTAEGGKDITALLTHAGNKQTNAGDAYTLTLTGGDNFINQATETWSIGRAKLSVTAPTAITFMDKAASELSDYLTTVKWITGFFGSDGYTLGAWTNDPEDSAVTIGDVDYAAAGTYIAAVRLTGENADTNYELSESTLSVTVNKLDIGSAAVAVTWKESDLTYDAAKQSVSLASVTVSGVDMPVEWFTPQNNTGTDADTYTATVAASNANITGSVSKDFTIDPFAVTVKWKAAGEISVDTAMPEDATDMSALGLTARVTEFKAPGITDSAQYSIVVTASGFEAGHSFAAGDKVTLTPSMTFAEGVKAGNYQITYAPETIVKTATAISVEVSPPKEPVSVTYGDSVTSADGFISKGYFTIMSGAEGSALTPDNFTVTVTDENGAAVFDSMHGLDAGTYTVTIEGKGAYSVSNENNYFIYTVAPLTLTQGTWSGVDGLTYNGKAAAPVFEPVGVLDGDNVSVGYTIVGDKATDGQAINAGSYTVTAQSGNANYVFDGKVNVKTFTIAQMVLQGGLTVDPDLTYDGTSKAGYATWTWTTAPLKEGDVTANITFTKDGEDADPIAAGDYTAIVTLTDNTGNYDTTEITSTVDFTIEQLEVVLNWEAVGDDDLVYDGAPHELTATVSNKVVGDEVEVSVELAADNNNVNVTEQGFVYVAIGLTGADAGNYKLPENKQSKAFKVTPAQVKLTWNFVEHATIVYGDSVEDVKKLVNIGALNGTIPGVTDPLAFEVSVGDYSATTNAGTEVTFTVTAKLPEGATAENYEITVNAADGNNKLTVQKADITVTVSVGDKTYDGLAVTPSVTVKFGERELGASEYGTVTYTYEIKGGDTLGAAPADASDSAYTVTASVAESTNFNAATSAADEFTIAPKSIGVEWGNTEFTYNGSAQKPNATVGEGLVSGDDLQITVSGAETDANTDGGSYTATAEITGGEDMGNYVLDGSASTSFTIARKALTVLGGTAEFDFGVINNTDKTYKDQIEIWDSTKDKVITGFFGNDTYTLGDIKTADAIQEVVYTDGKLNAGSYYVSYTVDDNYTIGSSGQTGLILLTVNKLSYEISLTYTIDSVVQSGWDGNISFEHDAPITLTFASNALEITFNDGSDHTHVVTVKYDGDGTLPNVTFTLGGITINKSNPKATISSVQSMNVTAQITPDDETNHQFTGKTSFNFVVKRNTRVEANEKYFNGLGIPSEYTGSSISVAGISKTEAFTVTLGGTELTGAEVSIAATLNGEPTESICNAGDYVITATYTTDTDEIVTGTYEFTVAQAKLSFTLDESALSIVYGEMSADVMPDALKAFTATGVKGKSVAGTFAITVGLNENIYSGAGFVKAGSYNFTITFTPDDDNYAELVYNSADDGVKLTVAQKTITPFAISYEQVVSEGTTLTLTYAGKDAYANNLDIAPNGKFEDDDVEFIDDGDYSAANEDGHTPQIRIYESGDGGNYKLDLSGWKVVVLKKAIKVTVTADSDTYTGSAITLTATSEEVVKGDDVTFTVGGGNGDGQTVTNAGTYVLTVTLGGEQGGNYEVAGELSVTINKATVDEIVYTNQDYLKAAVYNGQPYEATAKAMFKGQSVGSVSFEYFSIDDYGNETQVEQAVDAGKYRVKATFAATDNFYKRSSTIQFEIAKMVLYGKWNVASDMDLTYDGTNKAGYATWSWTTAAPLNEGDVTVGYQYKLNGAIVDDVIDAGNYKVSAVFTDNTGNYDTESGILQDYFDELTVARRAVTVKWSESVSFTYNGAEQAPTATALNVAEGDSLDLVVTGAKKDVGTYTATVAAASVTGNYVLEEDATVKFTIAPKSIGVEWGNTAFTYNGKAQAPTATATGLVGGDRLDLDVTDAQTNAGSYTATVEAFEQGNYKLESTSTQAFTIAKADLTVTPASLDIRERETEDMKAFAEGEDLVEAFAGRISVSGVSGTVSYTVAIVGDNNYDDDGLLTVGAHTFTIDAGDNYNAASVRVTVIETTVVTVIASVEGELVYNGSAFEISYALKEGAPDDVSMDDITVTPSVETIVNAGEYEVNFTVTGSNKDYDYVVQDASGNAALTFTIARRGLDVAEVAEAVYGDLQVSGTLVTGTHTAFVAYNDEEIELIVNVKTAALSRAAAEYLDAGEYEVTIALANEEGNFSLNGATLNAETEKMEVQSTLDVAPKTIEVGYTPSSEVYDAKGISITLDKFENMLIEGDDPAVNIYINDALYTGKVVLDAGEYTVRYESADPNYAFAPVSATFTVATKSVTPSFDLNTGTGSQQITGGGKLEIEEGEETDIVAAIDNFMQSSGVPEEDLSISVSGDLKLEEMATWAPGTYTVTVTLSGNHSGSMEFTVEVSEKIELPPPVEPELPETPAEAGSGNDWVLPLVIAIVALIDLALLVAIGVAAKKRA